MVDSPSIGLLVDVWDIFASGGNLETIRGLSVEQIVAVQVSQIPTEGSVDEMDESSRLLPGAEGRIDMAGALRALAEMGYEGPVTVVPSRSVFSSRRRDAVVRQASESLNKVWRAAGLTADGKPGPMPEPVAEPVSEPAATPAES